ncbi:MAG: FixH family protein [Chlamydiales bacterium]|nr:FixH family protein [Chlamydiales bacterium]
MMRQLFFLLVACYISACSSSNIAPLDEFQSGSLTVQVSMLPDPPKLNSNSLFIKIEGSEKKPVLQAKVSASFAMPAMAAMAAMNASSTISELGNGLYSAAYYLCLFLLFISVNVTAFLGGSLTFGIGHLWPPFLQ